MQTVDREPQLHKLEQTALDRIVGVILECQRSVFRPEHRKRLLLIRPERAGLQPQLNRMTQLLRRLDQTKARRNFFPDC
jgi:hypothetical protein